jgi:hypothetical protein
MLYYVLYLIAAQYMKIINTINISRLKKTIHAMEMYLTVKETHYSSLQMASAWVQCKRRCCNTDSRLQKTDYKRAGPADVVKN